MDEAQYTSRCEEFDEQIRKIESAIGRYTADELVDHEEDIKSPLAEIEAKYVALEDSLTAFYKEFNRAANPEWVVAWETKIQALEQKYKQNAREVKLKAIELRKEAKATSAPSSDIIRENREKKEIEGKAQVRKEYILGAIRELEQNVKKPGSAAKLEDFDVIRYLKESRKWIIELREIDRKVYDLKELVVMYPLPSDQAKELDSLHKAVKEDVTKAVSELETEDTNRQLYTLAPSNSKDSLPYPKFK